MDNKNIIDTVLKSIDQSSDTLVNIVKNVLPENENNVSPAFRKSMKKGLDISSLPYYKTDPYRYRFQAYTITKQFLYITAHGEKGDPSILMVYDENGKYHGKILLPQDGGRDAHVGGISFDSKRNILFLTGTQGKVLALNNTYLEKAIKDSMLLKGSFVLDMDTQNFVKRDFILDGSVNINDEYAKKLTNYYVLKYEKAGKSCPYTKEELLARFKRIKLKAASTFFDEKTQRLYVSTFSACTNVFVYDVKFEEKKVTYKLCKIYGLGLENKKAINESSNLPYGVQGIYVYHDVFGNENLLLSTSYGKTNSVITRYKINKENKLEFSGYVILRGQYGIQNMMMDGKGNILLNYENFSLGCDGSTFYEVNVLEMKGKLEDSEYVNIMNKIKEKIRKYDEASNYTLNENGDIVL